MRLAWCVALLLAACGGPLPRESYYTLSMTPSPQAVDSASTLSVYVGPVTVPESVDRVNMVLSVSPNQVEISDTLRWAEPLKTAIPRVLAATLSRELRTPLVFASRAGAIGPVDYRVAIEVQRFESSLEAGATIVAAWNISPTRKGLEPRNGRSVVQEALPTRDAQGLAVAHSRALEKIGIEIAAAIR
jgi:uncharacterized protein